MGEGDDSAQEVKSGSGTIPAALFTKQGYCVVQLVDVADIVEVKKKATRLPWAKKETERFLTFSSVSIRDENDFEIYKYYASVLPYVPSETLKVNEEFVFEAVSSNHQVVISVYVVTMNWQTDPFDEVVQRCVGIAKVPLSRLEENRSVRCSCSSV